MLPRKVRRDAEFRTGCIDRSLSKCGRLAAPQWRSQRPLSVPTGTGRVFPLPMGSRLEWRARKTPRHSGPAILVTLALLFRGLLGGFLRRSSLRTLRTTGARARRTRLTATGATAKVRSGGFYFGL